MYRSTNKKTYFFPNLFSTFFKKPQILFFFPTESKESSVHEQATTEFLIVSCGVKQLGTSNSYHL